jgi:hypothetical protein
MKLAAQTEKSLISFCMLFHRSSKTEKFLFCSDYNFGLQEQQINTDHQMILPVRHADGTTRKTLVIIYKPGDRANTAASPYNRPEHHKRWSNGRLQRSPPRHDDGDDGPTKVVCLARPTKVIRRYGLIHIIRQRRVDRRRRTCLPWICPLLRGGKPMWWFVRACAAASGRVL